MNPFPAFTAVTTGDYPAANYTLVWLATQAVERFQRGQNIVTLNKPSASEIEILTAIGAFTVAIEKRDEALTAVDGETDVAAITGDVNDEWRDEFARCLADATALTRAADDAAVKLLSLLYGHKNS